MKLPLCGKELSITSPTEKRPFFGGPGSNKRLIEGIITRDSTPRTVNLPTTLLFSHIPFFEPNWTSPATMQSSISTFGTFGSIKTSPSIIEEITLILNFFEPDLAKNDFLIRQFSKITSPSRFDQSIELKMQSLKILNPEVDIASTVSIVTSLKVNLLFVPVFIFIFFAGCTGANQYKTHHKHASKDI